MFVKSTLDEVSSRLRSNRSIDFNQHNMAGTQLALIKNLCLCYCDNQPGKILIDVERWSQLKFLESLDKVVNTVAHLLHG